MAHEFFDPKREKVTKRHIAEWLIGVSTASAAVGAGVYIGYRRRAEASNHYDHLVQRYPKLDQLIEGAYSEAPKDDVKYLLNLVAKVARRPHGLYVPELKTTPEEIISDGFETVAHRAIKALSATESPLLKSWLAEGQTVVCLSDQFRDQYQANPEAMPQLTAEIERLTNLKT